MFDRKPFVGALNPACVSAIILRLDGGWKLISADPVGMTVTRRSAPYRGKS
jgi:hypothetical protein